MWPKPCCVRILAMCRKRLRLLTLRVNWSGVITAGSVASIAVSVNHAKVEGEIYSSTPLARTVIGVDALYAAVIKKFWKYSG
ncbi:MAG: hypothetical protein IH897_14695 [Planctomycetes bacterium]|nr:hypothetical protein [Planctomycetota bacterium]